MEKDYMQKVKDKAKEFTAITHKQCLQAVRDLRVEGKSWEWIYSALTYKTNDEWECYGFGLMFNNSFRKQVDRRVEPIEDSTFWEMIQNI